MRILLTGANGFIGAAIAAALERNGHEVVRAVRRPAQTDLAAGRALACDMARDTRVADWRSRLSGIDCVVNCAGILREQSGERFQTVHVDAPSALFEACVQTGVRRVVQISALGASADAEFIASKHRADAALAALDLEWTVLRPSIVYSAAGSYGGTSLLRAMATLPGVLLVPGHGEQAVQPIALEDLAQAVVSCLASARSVREVFEVGGPEVLTIRAYLVAWRRWFGLSSARVVPAPTWLVGAACAIGEHLGHGPLGRTMQVMLERGNVTQRDALARMHALLDLRPMTLAQALAQRPCQSQDRLHAFTYLLFPTLQWVLAVIWLLSASVGFAAPAEDLRALFASAGLSPDLGPVLVRAVSVLDAVLGVAVLWPRAVRAALWLMLGSVLGYSILIGTLWPRAWFDPYGGLLKNLALLPALALLLAWQRCR